ncbi:ATP-binding cassette sub-family A member 2-like isoform X1 [Branchiostoma floridae x Branchiostoma japonicum]
MGFLHQLRLLLWKNFTLKKRSPWVAAFELFIPLVLFFILMAIRQKKPARPHGESYFAAQPLPSSGVLPVMQALCPGGHRDSYGFPRYDKSTAYQFLERLSNSVQQNALFDEDSDVRQKFYEILHNYESLVNDPNSLEQRFAQAKDFSLGSVLTDKSEFQKVLMNNLSLSQDAADYIINTPIHIQQLYALLFGSPTRNLHNATDQVLKPKHIWSVLQGKLNSLKDGLVYQTLTNPQKLSTKEGLLALLGQSLGLGTLGEKAEEKVLQPPQQMVKSLESVLLTPDHLQYLVCNSSAGQIITQQQGQEGSMAEVHQALCNTSHTKAKFTALAEGLKAQLNQKAVVDQLGLDQMDIVENQEKMESLMEALEEFAIFQSGLHDLSDIASVFPSYTCSGITGEEGEAPTDPASQAVTAGSVGPDADCNPPDTGPTQEPYGNRSSECTDGNSTVTEPDTPTSQVHHVHNKLSGFIRIWTSLQPTICGVNKTMTEEALEAGDLRSMGYNKKERRDLGLLLHLLTSNPKILYSPNGTWADSMTFPNGTEIDKVIKKVAEPFTFISNVTFIADQWLNRSRELRHFIQENSTQQDIQWLRQLKDAYAANPQLLNMTTNPVIRRFVQSSNVIPNVTTVLKQLENIDNLACGWIKLVSNFNLSIFMPFPNEEALVNYTLHQAQKDNVTVFASVVFNVTNTTGQLPAHMVFKIRQNASFTQKTTQIRRKYWRPNPNHGHELYYQFGFIWIQDMIERALINVVVGHDVVEPGSYVHEFPYPCFMADDFLFMIEHMMPLCMTISWVYTVAMLVQNIVYEKEQRLKEVMKMMGLNNAVHWVAWFITSFLQMSLTGTFLMLILQYSQILTYSNPWITFLFIELYIVATISFSFFVSVLYSKAKVAAACGGIIYFLSYVPYMYVAIREEVANDKITAVEKSIACLMSTTAFGLGAKYFALYEESGTGIQWDNFLQSPVEGDAFNLCRVMVMLVVDSFVYCLLTWYIEAVHPGSYGLPRPWYFPFQKSYWFGHGRQETLDCHMPCSRGTNYSLALSEEDGACAAEDTGDEQVSFEEEPTHLPMGVCIHNLVKVYKTGNKLAVNKLALNLYEGQITSFLGHNGAGKTTTMSILTGLFPPTAGSATIYGHDIRTDMLEIRKSLGMCPQHNVLFDKLTVEEHVWFYARLKGMQSADIEKDLQQLIGDVGLQHKRKDPVSSLSGGMKRKLSVAIAFVGGSRTVILDEPTAGVDPYARRAIWDFLVNYKRGRTILLSTHHMDEADILGDRIAIISNGQLRACGTSLFLKSTFGDGYRLTVVKRPVDREEQGSGEPDLNSSSLSNGSIITRCVEQKVSKFIRQHVAGAVLLSDTNREISYMLPSEAVKKGCFEKLFSALQSKLDDLDLSSFGLTDTTLEEVFLKVTEATGNDLPEKEEKDSIPLPTPPEVSSPPVVTPGDPSMVELEMPVRGGGSSGVSAGSYDRLMEDGDNISQQSDEPVEDPICLDQEGVGSYRLEGCQLAFSQFWGLMIKRFNFSRRNTKALFSQIVLPALFICVAMTVALSVPDIGDYPPLVLSPSQYHNYTSPIGNFIPISDEKEMQETQLYVDATAQELMQTVHLPSGIGATCVLKSPFNDTLSMEVIKLNLTDGAKLPLTDKYFDETCRQSFVHGVRLDNYVPKPPTPAPPPKSLHQKQNIHYTTSFDPNPNHTVHENLPVPQCQCMKDNTGFLCTPDPYPPHRFKVITGDILLDVTGRNTSLWYLNTNDLYRLHRYGALSFGNVREYVPTSLNNIHDSAQSSYSGLRKLAVRHVAKAWYNHKGYHSMPTYLNTLNNAILRANIPKSEQDLGNPAAYGITVINHPMNETSTRLTSEYILQGTDVVIAIFIIVAMSFVPASFVVFLVFERSIKAKHLQFVSGVNPVIYWVSNYAWDMLNYLLPATCCVIILTIFDLPAYTSSTNFPAVVALFLMYGWSITPMMYPVSFWFNVPSHAYVFLIVINLFIGITATVATFMFQLFQYDKDLHAINEYMRKAFLLFPNYCLGRGLMDLAYNEYFNEYYLKIGQEDKVKSPFDWELVTRSLVAMAAEGLVFFFITILCEYKFFFKPKYIAVSDEPIEDEDIDVANERQRILRGDADKDLMKLANLTKVYKTSKRNGQTPAVDRLCVAVPNGECFGLLGVNGAGKTTTFKMLTGEIAVTGGEAFLNEHSILKDIIKVHQSIGYCPQFDALLDELTARGHLTMYARLRGIPWSETDQVVNWALRKLALMPYADKPAGTLSGGNKRKLSTAIALIGFPPLIFLDEPTTGMDPAARRFLWDLIKSIIQTGRSVILTSHSMEECEALCTRLAIMVNGRFKCLGSIQHLKNRFGDGYMITVRVKPGAEVKQVVRFFNRTFPEAVMKERHHNMVQYELKSADLSLSFIFSKMEEVQETLRIEDYSVSQTTLDNVFVNFAKKQSDIFDDSVPTESTTPSPRRFRLFRRRTETEMQPIVLSEETLDQEEAVSIQLEQSMARLDFIDSTC